MCFLFFIFTSITLYVIIITFDQFSLGHTVVRFLALVRPCLGLFPLYCPSSFYMPYESCTIILVSASSSYFTLAVLMCKVSCVEYTPCAWEPCPC